MTKFCVTLCLSLLLAACASSQNGSRTGINAEGNSSRIAMCKSTDTMVNSASQCLQDGAACYQLTNGQWCTGERGNICPAGSTALAKGAACPPGRRCFQYNESLFCAIN